MVGTVQTAFPDVMFWLHEYGDAFLLARMDNLSIDMKQWSSRISNTNIAGDLGRVGVKPPMEILGFLAWGPRDSDLFAKGAKICTDDNPYYEFSTPRVRYIPADVASLRMKLQLFGPLQPLPIKPDTIENRSLIAEMSLDRGNLARALVEFQRAWSLNPDNSGIGMKCAYIQWDLLYRGDDAIATLKTILKRNPGNAAAQKKLREVETGKRYSMEPGQASN